MGHIDSFLLDYKKEPTRIKLLVYWSDQCLGHNTLGGGESVLPFEFHRVG